LRISDGCLNVPDYCLQGFAHGIFDRRKEFRPCEDGFVGAPARSHHYYFGEFTITSNWPAKTPQYVASNILSSFSYAEFVLVTIEYMPPTSTSEVLDLFREIQCQLWESLDRFEGRSAPETWAYCIALHTASAWRRNNDRRKRALRAYEQDLQTEQRGGRGEEQILQEFVESLPEMDRNLFTMYLADLSYQEIAEFADISEINLRVRISRLRNQFEQRYL
jgi:RNA polymerase sigma factor (sigma-70 family)